MIIYFSGGKDSLAVLHMFKDDPALECVYFGDPGDTYPHMLEFIIDTCKKFKVPLEIIKAKMPQKEYHEKFGYPSDMLPVVRTPETQSTMKNAGKQSSSHSFSVALTCVGSRCRKPHSAKWSIVGLKKMMNT